MQTLKWVIITVLLGYAALVALLYAAQRSMMYFPESARTPPAAAGFPQAREVVLPTIDGERVIVWHVAPGEGRPVVLYFHGNGAALRWRVERFRALTADGTGLIALSYRGYGGSSGRPTEPGLVLDAQAAYKFAVKNYPAERLMLWGESLGSAVAVALAAERPVARIILESPFSSAVDIAASAYPFVPVRILMWDQFRSDERIGKIAAPILVIHGERDRIVPIRFGERLYARIQSPKRFVRLRDGDHNDLDAHGALAAAKAFLSETKE